MSGLLIGKNKDLKNQLKRTSPEPETELVSSLVFKDEGIAVNNFKLPPNTSSIFSKAYLFQASEKF